jgi:hypothetical protein
MKETATAIRIFEHVSTLLAWQAAAHTEAAFLAMVPYALLI